MAVHYDDSDSGDDEQEKENAKKVQEQNLSDGQKMYLDYLKDHGYNDEQAKAELEKVKNADSAVSRAEIMSKVSENYNSSKDIATNKSEKKDKPQTTDISKLGSIYSSLLGYSGSEMTAAENKIAEADNQTISEIFNANPSANDRNNMDFSLRELSNVFGLPYQFDEVTDPPVDGTKIGRLYLEKILSKMPLLVMTPGLPSFMAGESASKQYSVINDLIKGGVEGLGKIDNSFSAHSKYYSLVFAASEYYEYVNTLCQALAYFLGIREITINTNDGSKEIADIDWGSTAFFNKDFATNMSYLGGVAFYVNAETSVSESFSNSTSESILKSKINEFSDLGREIQFITGGMGVGPKFAAAKQVDGKESTPTKDTGMISKFISNLQSASKTIFAGGKLIFPSLWGDSDYSPPSNSVSIRLTCPDYDKVSWFLNIGVPLMHLICLTAPRQAGPNGYVSPFLVKAFYKGVFNVNMGMIGSLQVNKGQEGGWTIDNLPTIVDVQLEIKDLYSKFVISKARLMGTDSTSNNIIENTSLLTYLGNMAGVNFNLPDLVGALKLYAIFNKTAVTNTIGTGSIMYGLSENVADVVSKVAAANIFKYD